MRMAGLSPTGVLCELTNADGIMSRLPDVVRFAELHDFPVLSIDDLVTYKSKRLAEAI